jgi:hypothetical protein
MGYVEIDPQGAHLFGQAMTQASAEADTALRQAVSALTVAELSSDASAMLGALQDRLATLGAGVMAKAELAEQVTAQPVRAPVRGIITYTDNDDVPRAIEVRPGGEYDIPRDHLFRDSRVPYLPPYNLVPPGFTGRNPVIDLPDGTRFRVVPGVQDIPHSDASPSGRGPIADLGDERPGPDDSGERTGFAFGQDLLSADLSGWPALADPFDDIEGDDLSSIAPSGLDPAWTWTTATLDWGEAGAVNWGWQDDSYTDAFESFASPIDLGADPWSGLETTEYYDTTSVLDYL